MAFKDMLSLCGRIGLIVVAFAFVAGIVAGPILERIWSSRLTVTQNNEIGAGALDGTWGSIANDAAQGAAVKIKTLIDNDRASGKTSATQKVVGSRS